MNVRLIKILSIAIPGRLLRHAYLLKDIRAIRIKELRLNYLPIPKVASSSIKTCLANKIDLNYDNGYGYDGVHLANWDFISAKYLYFKTNHYQSFCFVRNPFDRLVSCYIQKFNLDYRFQLFWKYGNLVKPNMSFEEFAEFVIKTPDGLSDEHFKSQNKFLCYKEKLVVDFVGKFEKLDQDWDVLARQFELSPLPHINKTEKKPIDHYYSYDLAKRIRDRYAKDIELFNYQNEVDQLLGRLKKKRAKGTYRMGVVACHIK